MLSAVLIFIATSLYPGGSPNDISSHGFSWQHNYLCNLFDKNAINGQQNSSRIYAIAGIFSMCLSLFVFFYQTSLKLSKQSGQKIVRYTGCFGMLIAFFAVSPMHDAAINISNILCLISIFYILVFLFRTKQKPLLWLSVLLMLVSYITIYIYYSGYHITYLPLMQKLTFIVLITWALAINYSIKQDA